MKLGEINQLTENSNFKLYTGVCPVKVIAINPTKKELETIYGREYKDEPVYTSEVEVNVGTEKKKVKQGRVEFIVKNEELNIISRMNFFLEDAYIMGSNTGKYRIIDNYGNEAWATPEEIKAGTVPVNKNGKTAKIDKNYRLQKRGEIELISFIRNLLGIKSSHNYVDNEWVLIPDPSKAYCSIENLDAIFNGNVTELRPIVNLAQNNQVKVLFGVRTTSEGKNYQSIYERYTEKANVQIDATTNTYVRFKNAIEERKAQGALQSFTFTFGDIQEFEVSGTTFKKPEVETPSAQSSDLPF